MYVIGEGRGSVKGHLGRGIGISINIMNLETLLRAFKLELKASVLSKIKDFPTMQHPCRGWAGLRAS